MSQKNEATALTQHKNPSLEGIALLGFSFPDGRRVNPPKKPVKESESMALPAIQQPFLNRQKRCELLEVVFLGPALPVWLSV